jgi:polyisoprenoid-binding protein YceI
MALPRFTSKFSAAAQTRAQATPVTNRRRFIRTMAYNIDASHSLIEFAVKHMMVTTVKGRFTKFQGDVEIDETTPANSKVDVTIDATSISTGDANRDGHLRSADFFEPEKYPTIAFHSKKVEPHGSEKYRVTGDFTMHGVTRELSFDITREGVTKNMKGQALQAFSATLVSDQVKISLEVEVVEPATVAA